MGASSKAAFGRALSENRELQTKYVIQKSLKKCVYFSIFDWDEVSKSKPKTEMRYQCQGVSGSASAAGTGGREGQIFEDVSLYLI